MKAPEQSGAAQGPEALGAEAVDHAEDADRADQGQVLGEVGVGTAAGVPLETTGVVGGEGERPYASVEVGVAPKPTRPYRPQTNRKIDL
jgi:hypothetical protein